MRECQLADLLLTHRYRGQAPSHIFDLQWPNFPGQPMTFLGLGVA